jgi:Sulfotransferase family
MNGRQSNDGSGRDASETIPKHGELRGAGVKSHVVSVLAIVVGCFLIAAPLGTTQAPAFVPQDEPIVRSRGAHHVFSIGERVSLIDFLAADVRRARRGERRLANQSILSSTEAESRRRRAQSRNTAVNSKHAGRNEGTDISLRPQDAASLGRDYWRDNDGQYGSALSIERSTLLSPSMDRILVATRHRTLFCPIPGVADDTLVAFLEKAEGVPPGTLQRLSSFAIRDRERFLTSKTIFRFAFVRHPFIRAALIYTNGVNGRDLDSEAYRQFMGLVRGRPLRDHEREMQRLTSLFYLTFLGRQSREQLDEIFQPQVDLCGVGSIDYQLVGRLESFEADFSTVAEMLGVDPPTIAALANGEGQNSDGKTIAETTQELFRSSKHRNKVAKLYAGDLETLGYSTTEPASRTTA